MNANDTEPVFDNPAPVPAQTCSCTKTVAYSCERERRSRGMNSGHGFERYASRDEPDRSDWSTFHHGKPIALCSTPIPRPSSSIGGNHDTATRPNVFVIRLQRPTACKRLPTPCRLDGISVRVDAARGRHYYHYRASRSARGGTISIRSSLGNDIKPTFRYLRCSALHKRAPRSGSRPRLNVKTLHH
jgi:hypothetical protein